MDNQISIYEFLEFFIRKLREKALVAILIGVVVGTLIGLSYYRNAGIESNRALIISNSNISKLGGKILEMFQREISSSSFSPSFIQRCGVPKEQLDCISDIMSEVVENSGGVISVEVSYNQHGSLNLISEAIINYLNSNDFVEHNIQLMRDSLYSATVRDIEVLQEQADSAFRAAQTDDYFMAGLEMAKVKNEMETEAARLSKEFAYLEPFSESEFNPGKRKEVKYLIIFLIAYAIVLFAYISLLKVIEVQKAMKN